ncbi:MAG: hypothetical protein IKH31_03950 [Clostridia bacterium]|nr:hypothetical protein [Clostridia bacterium]
MNLLDFVIIAILGLFVLAGVYKGFLYTSIDILLFILCAAFAFLVTPLVTFKVEQNEKVFNTMLYYTEGSENIEDVEYRKKNITEISNAELEEIYEHSKVAYPMDERIRENVAAAAFERSNIYTLGDYFNTTMVIFAINVLLFLVFFIGLRLVLAFLLGWLNYARPLPVLKKLELPAAIGVGLIRGILALFLFFMTVPLVLTVLPLDFVSDLVEGSVLARFFYYSNFLLNFIHGA